ncbi:MAG TPA: ribosome silencing factor [Parafilimonas sp.]
MEPITALTSRKKNTIVRLNSNSRILKLIVKAIQEKKGEKIVSLDLRKIPEAVSDYFIICEATSTTQIRAIADFVEETIKKQTGELPYHHEGYETLHWILIDYINIVVHIMQPDARKFYRLEEMWSDAALQEYN